MSKSDHPYTALFCEENIWHLANTLMASSTNADAFEVIFISNPQEQVVLFSQQVSPVGHYVIWDYHVILLDRIAGRIYDFDSRLPFPSPLDTYLEQTLPKPEQVADVYLPRFRCVRATDYVQRFSSDRSHMVDQIPPEQCPDWPLIQALPPHRAVQLSQYRDMSLTLEGTHLCDSSALLDHFILS